MQFSETLAVTTVRHPTLVLGSKPAVGTDEWEGFCTLLTLVSIISFMLNCLNFSLPDLKWHTDTLGLRWLSQTAPCSLSCLHVLIICRHSRAYLANKLTGKGTVSWRKVGIGTAHTQPAREGLGSRGAGSCLQQNCVYRCAFSQSSSFLCWLHLPAWIISASIKEYLWNMPPEFHPQHF